MDSLIQFNSNAIEKLLGGLSGTSAVKEGRTIIDYKIFDVQKLVAGNGSGTTGTVNLPVSTTYFDYTGAYKKMQVGSSNRVTNMVQPSKADNPYYIDRIAVTLGVYDEKNKAWFSAGTLADFNTILNSGKLTLKVNGKDLNFVEPLGYAGSSVAYDVQSLAYFGIKKTPKLIDPAIFMPETTDFSATVEFEASTAISELMSVWLGIELIGYKFLKNS